MTEHQPQRRTGRSWFAPLGSVPTPGHSITRAKVKACDDTAQLKQLSFSFMQEESHGSTKAKRS
jgi:hypothetical protein